MKHYSLKAIVNPGIISSGLPVLLGLVLWGVAGIFYTGESAPFATTFIQLRVSGIFSTLLSLIITILIGFLLSRIIELFTIIRTRTYLPTFFFILIIACNPILHEAYDGLLAVLILLWTLWEILPMYQNNKAVRNAFNVMLILSMGSWFMFDILYFVPVFIIGFSIFQSLSIRTFIAGLIGLIMPFLIEWGILYLWGNPLWLIHYYTDNWQLAVPDKPDISSLIYFSILIILYIISFINLLINSHQEKIKTRKSLNFLILLFLWAVIVCITKGSKWSTLAPAAIFFLVPLISHFFSLKNNRLSYAGFWLLFLSSLAFFIYQLFFI